MSNLKYLSQDSRIRGIVQKHMDALSHEIAQELTQPLLEQWGLTRDDLAAVTAVPPETISEPVVPKALLYDKRSRLWICPRCEHFANLIRRSVTTHLRFCTAEPKAKANAPSPKPRGTRRRTKKKP